MLCHRGGHFSPDWVLSSSPAVIPCSPHSIQVVQDCSRPGFTSHIVGALGIPWAPRTPHTRLSHPLQCCEHLIIPRWVPGQGFSLSAGATLSEHIELMSTLSVIVLCHAIPYHTMCRTVPYGPARAHGSCLSSALQYAFHPSITRPASSAVSSADCSAS